MRSTNLWTSPERGSSERWGPRQRQAGERCSQHERACRDVRNGASDHADGGRRVGRQAALREEATYGAVVVPDGHGRDGLVAFASAAGCVDRHRGGGVRMVASAMTSSRRHRIAMIVTMMRRATWMRRATGVITRRVPMRVGLLLRASMPVSCIPLSRVCVCVSMIMLVPVTGDEVQALTHERNGTEQTQHQPGHGRLQSAALGSGHHSRHDP